MALRNLSLPTDLKELGPMLAESFQYPENPDWSVQDDERESLIEDINSLRRWWWIVQIAQVFSKKMRELLPGKVWIEDGKIAGAVLYQRRRFQRQLADRHGRHPPGLPPPGHRP